MVVCNTKRCGGECRPGRRFCSKCYKRKSRANKPILSAYTNLKSHAKERGILFNLSLSHWYKFCEETGYIQGKGTEAHSLSVDRIKPWLGYVDGNIQVLTISENTKKSKSEWRTDHRVNNYPDTPF